MTIEHDLTSDAIYIHMRPAIAYAFGEDLDTERRIDYGADQRPIGVELLNVSHGVNLADLPEPNEIARLLAGAGVKVLTAPGRVLAPRGAGARLSAPWGRGAS